MLAAEARIMTLELEQLEACSEASSARPQLQTEPPQQETPQQQQRTHLHASGISIPPLDGHEAIHLWCPPPFFPNDVNFQNVVLNKLLKKYCNVPSICEEAMKGEKKAAEVETVEE